MKDITVTFNPSAERYEIRLSGALVGHAVARRRGGLVTMPHVEIDTDQRGKNLANVLVRTALEDIRARGERVVAQCPFVLAFLRRFREFGDLVA